MAKTTSDFKDFAAPGRSSALESVDVSTRAETALHGIYEISKVLAVPGRLETTLSNVLILLSSFVDLERGMIAILDDSGQPGLVVDQGWSGGGARSHFDRVPEQAVGQVVTTKMPLIVEDVSGSPLFANQMAADWGGTDHRVSFISVPINDRDRVIGVMIVDRTLTGNSKIRIDEDVRLLAMVANLVGPTIRLHDLIVRDRERLLDDQRRLSKALSENVPAESEQPQVRGIIGESQAIRVVLDRIKVAARSNSTVLLRGESGTGKELFARATHELSVRHKGPFIKLNCAALPESVLESELFGHEKGAFTGAQALRKGRFELADGGTLFLDEIGEISASFQAKLLRVLQEGEFERVGGMRTLKVDFRLVAATNRNLEDAVARGEFRADLYYRINVISILLPPLRDRPEDIGALAREFLRRFNKEHGMALALSPSAMEVLEGCCFPGNVRELENCMRRTATLAKGEKIVADDFACRNDICLSSTLWRRGTRPQLAPARMAMPLPVFPSPPPLEEEDPVPVPAFAATAPELPPAAAPAGERLDSASSAPVARASPVSAPSARGEGAIGRERLIEAMEAAGWTKAKAARLLKVTTRQVGYALHKYNIQIKKI
jgi:Nif-specific regulatory protein